MKQYILRLLLLVNLLLMLALAALWVTPQGTLRNVQWQPPLPQKPEFSDAGASLSPLGVVSVGSFMATLDRPLFSPSRRPPPPPPPVNAAVPEPDPLANIQLQGVYSGSGGGGIFAKIDGKDRRLAIGATLGSWSVKSIDNREVTFVRGDETRVLRLVPSRLAVAAPPPASRPGDSAAGSAPAATAQADDPVRKQEQERQEKERARLELRNARRAAQGFPLITQ